MRIIIICCVIFFSFNVVGQTGTIKVEKKEDFIPRIAGRAGGDISRYFLCDSEGITIGHNSKVVSFVLYTLDANNQEIEVEIKGNKLSDKNCKILMGIPDRGVVYFQEIMVESKGVRVKVSPMMFFLKDED